MNEESKERFLVVIEEGNAHGGLYELEQTTYYRVVDTYSNKPIMTFQAEMSASLVNGMWDNYYYSGVCEVTLSADNLSVYVKYYNGQTEIVSLPK